MGTVKIAVLMTGAAFFRGHAVTLSATPYIHGMGVSIIALPGEVSRRMAVHTSRVPQDGDKRREERSISSCRRRCVPVFGGRFCRGERSGEQQRATKSKPRDHGVG